MVFLFHTFSNIALSYTWHLFEVISTCEWLVCRLPIVQAGTFAVLMPTLAYFELKQWECPANIVTIGWSTVNS